MASKLCRCIQLWLTIFLCWFVLRGDPVTQESESDIEHLSTEKVNLAFTENEATPPLASIHHTQTIIPDILDQNTLVKRPAIAPATPWDDAQILSTVSDKSTKTETSTEHRIITEKQIAEVENPSHIENIEVSKPVDDEQKEIEVDNSGNDDDNDLKKLIKALDPVESVESQDTISETSLEQSGDEDGGKVEHVDDKKKQTNNANEGLEKVENAELPETQQFSFPEEVPQTSNKKQDELPESELPNPGQTSQVDEDMTGTQDGLEVAQEDLDGAQDGLEGTQEDMPSFNEWSQKFLAQEEEKKVQLINEKGSSDTGIQQKKKMMDRKQNNFASVDCGANIPEKNSEAQNAHSILLENKDLYMLNPCSAGIWFIVELCDHVHVTSLQLANFEMFSSTVEKFQVSFSTRYPTREWSQLQSFVAKPEKSIQTFTIDPIFAKYIKVEQLSHHGTEHYCPWSLLRVYGNSMVEEYEEHESSHDENTNVAEDHNTSTNTTEDKHTPQGILKSATDAVLNFVKETAKKLVSTKEQTNSTNNATNVTKYPEDNSSQPLQPKTIVQLMPREDFEASCHGDNDDTPASCLPGNECGSTEYIPHSYQAFLQIVHNICGRNFKSAEACFTNLRKILVANKTNGKDKDSLNKTTEDIDLNSARNDEKVINPVMGEGDSQTVHQDQYSEGIEKSDDATVSIENSNKQEPKDGTTSSHTRSSEDSATSKSIHIDTQTSTDSAITSTVFPASTSSHVNSSSGSIQPATINSSVTSSIDHFDSASVPTPLAPPPLAQPPLAVNEEPNTAEAPTQQPEEIPKESISLASSDPPKSPPCENSDLSRTTETTSKIVTSPTSTLYESISSSSIVTESKIQTPQEHSSPLQDTPPVEGDTFVPAGPDSGKKENDEGHHGSRKANKELEEMPNPHVDVLKTTLTDAETKEATAEPEQDGDDTDDLVEEEKVLGRPSTEAGSDAEKDIKEAETNQDESENTQMDSEVQEKDQNIENDKDYVTRNEDLSQTQFADSLENSNTNIMKQDSSPPSEGQCEMKDATISKNHEETGSTNIDPGPLINIEAVPTQAGNGNTHGKKESIFVTLSRKIKALEQNVTMTNLFLEELSQRYRKSMDEMQKKMEKKFSMLSKNSKLLTKVNLSQNSSILALTSRVEQLEEKLNEATSRLKDVNQEVVERHVLGMCLQFLFLFIMWFLLRRVGGNTDTPARRTHVGNGHVKNGTEMCNSIDYRQQNGNIEDIEKEKNYLEEYNPSQPLTPEAISDTKRRRRRKNRPNSVASDHSLDPTPNQAQNIVSRTAGLLFHSPGHHDDNVRPAARDSGSPRLCSSDRINIVTQDERKSNAKRSAALSPKSKKVLFRNGNDTGDGKIRTFKSEPRITGERHPETHTKLVRSKSSGECYENKLALSDITLSTADPRRSLGNARCLLQSANDPLNDQKRRWIWGLG